MVNPLYSEEGEIFSGSAKMLDRAVA